VPCPYDATLSLKQMAFVSDTEAWAVGADGYIARWDGYTWTRVESPTDRDLNDVVFLSPDNGWAVGEGGIILHWDGVAWSVAREPQSPPPPGGYYLIWNAVGFSSPTDGWVVGCMDSEGGATLQAMYWNGKEWQDSLLPIAWTSYCLEAIAVLSPQDLWAVGGGSHGITLHWDGFHWQEIPNLFSSRTSPPAWFYSISAHSPDNVWIAGLRAADRGGTEGTALRWNGEEWLDGHLPPTGWVLAVLIISEDDGWVGGDELFHWNGQGWERAINPISDRVVDMKRSPNGEIWALTQHGAFLHLVVREEAR
jgi:photosystem II stability/assembly factor-like uncharacterized protein